ncbi:MAG: hypothetical protein JJV94_00440 [Sulfurospirillum sp.]|nr:hypothetical protein [Sulfurospirillum sp.]
MKKINSIVAMLLLSSNLSAINTNDVKSKMGNIPIGNVGGSTGIVFPEGKSRFVIKHISLTKNGSYNGDDEINDPKKSEMNVDRSLFLYRYGLGNGFDIRVATTYKKIVRLKLYLRGL